MADIVGVKFENSPRIYGFRSEGVEVKKGDRVVVESELGVSLGRVAVTECTMDDPEREVKPLLRKATDEDLAKERENVWLKEEASAFCNERIMARGLPMRLVATEITLDRKRYIFYFTADNRIDFRELVKDLASKFRTRIELRQIGVRDAASIVGGLGICGREFCCKTFLKSFYPISIKMAKQQDLVLNTAKLSGTCGRLMCCLNYEYVKPGDRKKMEEKARETCVPEEAAAPEAVVVPEETTETVEEKPETVEKIVEAVPEPPKKAEGPESGERPPQPEAEQRPEEKRRRKRRGRRRRHNKSPKGEQQAQITPKPGQQAQVQAAPQGERKDKPEQQGERKDKPEQQGERKDKPEQQGEGQGKSSRRSRRRWRPKKKK